VLIFLLTVEVAASEIFEGRAFYFGDLHVHTAASRDGRSEDMGQEFARGCGVYDCGAVGELADNARAEGLDFFALADHVNGNPTGDEGLFMTALDAVMAANDPEGGMVTVPAAEVHFVEGERLLGHKNLYLFGDDEQLAGIGWETFRFNGDSSKIDSCAAGFEWLEGVRDRFGPLALIPHHPAPVTPMPVDWTCHDPAVELAVEVYSHHGNSLTVDEGYDPPYAGIEREGAVAWALDVEQLKLGFIASTDDHLTWPGRTCVAPQDNRYGGGLAVVVTPEAESFSRMSIYEALVERRTYATSGPMIPATITYSDASGVLGGMGELLAPTERGPVTAELKIPLGVSPFVLGVELVTPLGVEVFEAAADGHWLLTYDSPAPWFYPRIRVDGAAWYGGEACPDNGDDEERIWLSPTWYDAPPEPTDEPSCGGCGKSGAAWLLVGLLGVRRRRERRQKYCR